MAENKARDEWLKDGIDNGWISEPFCSTHDIDPSMTDEEQEAWEAGQDPCRPVVRLIEKGRND